MPAVRPVRASLSLVAAARNMKGGETPPETLFLFVGPQYRIADVVGRSASVYPDLPAPEPGGDLRDFIQARIDAGYIGLNESLNIKSRTPLETRLLELTAYELFKTYHIGPQGDVLVLSHSRIDDQYTIISVSRSRRHVADEGHDRFERSASILDFDIQLSNMTGFGLIEHIAYSIINEMAVPLVVLNGDGLVLAANEAAQRVFEEGQIVIDERDRLKIPGDGIGEVLAHLRSATFGDTIYLPQYMPLGLHYARAINTPPLGKIFVLALDDRKSPPARLELLRKRFPLLSASEAEIGLQLLAGQPPKRIAQEREASIHTVRTQIASILKKTNCHSVASFIAVSRVFIF